VNFTLKRHPPRTDWLLLVAVPAFFFLWKLAAFGLVGADEPRYAQIAREMLARHDWVTPTLTGRAWLEKPPLYYWQAMLAYRAWGVSDWAARLPAVIDAWLLVAAIYAFLRRFRPGAELEGALLTATAAGVTGYARAASTDIPLTVALVASMLAWYCWFESQSRRWLLAFYALLALGALAKGPVAPVLAAMIVVVFSTSTGRAEMVAKTLSGWGVLLFALIALPWYVLVELRNPEFFRVFILEHNLLRFGTNLYHHREPFWYYLPVTLLGWVPWSAVVVAALARALGQWRSAARDQLDRFLVVWILTVVVFFSLSRSKLPGYTLPALPAGSVLAAECIQRAWRNRAGWLLSGLMAGVAGALILAGLRIDDLVLRHRIDWHRAVLPVVAALATAAGVFWLLARLGLRGLRAAVLVPTVVALGLALRSGALPLDETLSARPVASELGALGRHAEPVAVFLTSRETEYGLAFYLDQEIARYELGQVPAVEHFVVAPQGYSAGVSAKAERKAVYLGSLPAQKLDFFYVPAR
jgi:4-amino-4-deoxy-L-arabinose transferase-like glycosyltransferase